MPDNDNYCFEAAINTIKSTSFSAIIGLLSGTFLPDLTKVGQEHPIAQGRTAAVGMGVTALIFTPAYMFLIRNNVNTPLRGLLQFFGVLAITLLAYPTAQGIIPNEAKKTNYTDTTENIALGIFFAVIAKAVLGQCCKSNQTHEKPSLIRYIEDKEIDDYESSQEPVASKSSEEEIHNSVSCSI